MDVVGGYGPYDEAAWAAATKLQALYRTRIARQRLRWLLRSVYEKVFDPDRYLSLPLAPRAVLAS